MPRPTKDPTIGFTVTIRKSVLEKLEELRGDISRSKYVERAIEAKNAAMIATKEMKG